MMLRIEALGKGAFQTAFSGRRCILPADGFYEWQERGKTKAPHYIHRADEGPLALAGIWQPGDPDTCAVITKPAAMPLVDVHHRMPATVPRAHYETWLDPTFTDREAAAALVASDLATDLVVTEVGRWVNAAAHDDPQCIEPAREGTVQRQ